MDKDARCDTGRGGPAGPNLPDREKGSDFMLPLFSKSYVIKAEPSSHKKTSDLRQAHHHICAVPLAGGVLTNLKDSCPHPILFSLMTQRICEDFHSSKERKNTRDARLGYALRRDSLVFVGSDHLADQNNLPRELYLPGLTAAYPIFIIGSLLAIYGSDGNGEPLKVLFFYYYAYFNQTFLSPGCLNACSFMGMLKHERIPRKCSSMNVSGIFCEQSALLPWKSSACHEAMTPFVKTQTCSEKGTRL